MGDIINVYKNRGFMMGTLTVGYFLIMPINVMFAIAKSIDFMDYVGSILYGFMIAFLIVMFLREIKSESVQRGKFSRFLDIMIVSNHFMMFVSQIMVTVSLVLEKL